MPCYVCENIWHFLQWISFDIKNLHKFNWCVFDDLVFISNSCLEFANADIVVSVNHMTQC